MRKKSTGFVVDLKIGFFGVDVFAGFLFPGGGGGTAAGIGMFEFFKYIVLVFLGDLNYAFIISLDNFCIEDPPGYNLEPKLNSKRKP